MPGTIIVSNRLPVSVRKTNGALEYYPSSGGLATGLAGLTQDEDTLWIGWPGITTDELEPGEEEEICRALNKQNCHPLFLSKKQVDDYYNGYSNSVLWPFLHTMPADFRDSEKFYRAYKRVNKLFVETLLSLTNEPATVWVHDYQLLLVPEMLRSELAASSGLTPGWQIGFFLHIPIPASETFEKLPHAGSLLRGLLGADLLGFHTKEYAKNFLDACQQHNLGIASEQAVALPERVVHVTDFPLGIDYKKFSDARHAQAVKKELRDLQSKYGAYKTILTVDRLDPTKGFLERLAAYRSYLKSHPEMHGKVIMVMLAVPSRGEIDAYKRLRKQVERQVKTINNRYGKEHWKPIDYMHTSVPFHRLSALYQMADVAFVAPLRDGMNLVAKEYIASKHGKSGVLILSETAGAAAELGEALLVDPSHPASLTKALNKALSMPPKELKSRLKIMQKKLEKNTVQVWAGTFIKSLDKASAVNLVPALPVTPRSTTRIISKFKTARRRLLLLDYDGVLAPFVADPQKALPSERVKDILSGLGTLPNTTVVIVSGRTRENLERWLGDLPIDLAAEHGADWRSYGEEWQQLLTNQDDWKRYLKPALERYAKKTPGAFVEEKNHALVWHFRKSPPYLAHKNGVALRRNLKKYVAQFGLKIYNGNKIIEIKPPAASKAGIALRYSKNKPVADFIMAIGDDYTDEDMFMALPATSIRIKVGKGRTAAGYRLPSPQAVIELLEKLKTI